MDPFYAGWRRGIEKKATKVLDGGFMQISGERFAFSKVVATLPTGERTMLSLCIIFERMAYSFMVYSDESDPSADGELQSVISSLRVEKPSEKSTAPVPDSDSRQRTQETN